MKLVGTLLANTVSMSAALYSCERSGRPFNWYDSDSRQLDASGESWPHQQMLIFRKRGLSPEMTHALDQLDIARAAMRKLMRSPCVSVH